MLITDKEKLLPFHACHRVWQGIPGIARTKGGRTFISFFSGNTAETFGNFAAVLKSDTDSDFGEPVAVAIKEGKFRCFDPALWIDPLGRLWFIWNVQPGEEVHAAICEDPDADEFVWGEEFYIGRGLMINKPTVLSSGEWLFPIAIWRTDIAQKLRKSGLRPDEKAGAYVYKTSDNGKSFVCLGCADIRDRSFDEHMVLELKTGVLMMLVRTIYGIGVSYSYDRGNTWSVGENSLLGGPCSRFHIKRLRSGRILLINHHNFTGRNNLTAMLSEDDGKTFPYTLLLDERDDVSYPDAVECDDGYIYISYDWDRGCFKKSLTEAYASAREILTAKITEEDIINGKLTSKHGFLKNVVSKLGQLSPGDPDPYQEPFEDLDSFADSLLEEKDTIIEKLFTLYPINCVDAAQVDITKLDALIERFEKGGSSNKGLLLKIITLIRSLPKTTQSANPIIARACAYVQEHLTEDFAVSAIAAEMNISVYYLSHLFKSVTGISMLGYRNELRLTKAKQLLICSNDTISNIAIQCGYNNASYFSEMFSRSEKISPVEFRKYHTQNTV